MLDISFVSISFDSIKLQTLFIYCQHIIMMMLFSMWILYRKSTCAVNTLSINLFFKKIILLNQAGSLDAKSRLSQQLKKMQGDYIGSRNNPWGLLAL